MICEQSPVRSTRSRQALAWERAAQARAQLSACRLCAHECGVNRLAGPAGKCHAGSEVKFFMAQTEVSDELELIPTFAVALSGCDLRCDFCITGQESWNSNAGTGLNMEEMADRARVALAEGARTVMILGGEPTIHLPSVLELVAQLPAEAKLVWKTNAHGSAPARALLEGIFDVWVADFKFGNDACAERLARVKNYAVVVKENLLWAREHGELIVRHLLMPGHVECCWQPVAAWLAVRLPGVKVNVRSGFWPAWQARRHREFWMQLTVAELDQARRIAKECGLNVVP